MRVKQFFSLMLLPAVLATSGLGLSSLSNTLTPPAAAQSNLCNSIRSVNFTGRLLNYKANIRSGPSLSAPVLYSAGPNVILSFDAWTYGDRVNDLWFNQPDARWFKIRGQNAWVASGVVYGNPPGNPAALPPSCTVSPPNQGSFYNNPNAFFSWANNQVGIARLDTTNLRGQCVTLVARYIQEVFLPAAERNKSRAFGNGGQTASVVARDFSKYFEPVTSSGLPKRGAIISFPQIGFYQGVHYGHVAIVLESRTFNGVRQVKIIDSNSDSKGERSTVKMQSYWINIPNGSAQGYGQNIYWTNPR